jgi:hypothetical protein
MGRPKVNIPKLREYSTTEWLEFERQVLEAIEREVQALREARTERASGKRGRRRRR